MAQEELFQEGYVEGKIYLTGIIYRLTDPIEYLMVKPGRFKEADDVHVPWMIPGGILSRRDQVEFPRVNISDRAAGTVEQIIRAHIVTTIGIEITAIEFLLDPSHRLMPEVPVMAYYARYASGFPNEAFGYHSDWFSYEELLDLNAHQESLREVKALDNIFRERNMYREIESELTDLAEKLTALEGFYGRIGAPDETHSN